MFHLFFFISKAASFLMFQKNETSADNLQAQKDSPNELATTVYESTQNIT